MSIENSFLKSLNLKFHHGEAASLLLTYNKNLSIGPQSLAHLSPQEYIEHSYVTQEIYDSYFTFAFVRNPWERAVSFYKHYMFNRVMSFEDFLMVEFPKLQVERYYFVKPQTEYIYNEEGKLQVDFVGRFENLQQDFELMRSKLNKSISDLERINISNKDYKVFGRWNLKFVYKTLKQKPYLLRTLNLKNDLSGSYRDLYTEKARKIVEEFYKKDIEKLGYDF